MRNAINAKAEAEAGEGAGAEASERCIGRESSGKNCKEKCLSRTAGTSYGLWVTGYGLRATVAYKVQII